MKNILFLIVITGVIFLISCKDDAKDELIESLTGTVWKSERIGTENQWYQDELTFTDTEYSYIRRTWYGNTGGPNTGTYTFDYPTVTLHVEPIEEFGETYVQSTYGTVKGHSITVEVLTGDILWTLELKKQ
ncbi:MAG: hypothetical protein LBV47_09145 [Bacteroidales bacterium]|nr:hypothetical protein [Bacteroidales bacterium]